MAGHLPTRGVVLGGGPPFLAGCPEQAARSLHFWTRGERRHLRAFRGRDQFSAHEFMAIDAARQLHDRANDRPSDRPSDRANEYKNNSVDNNKFSFTLIILNYRRNRHHIITGKAMTMRSEIIISNI